MQVAAVSIADFGRSGHDGGPIFRLRLVLPPHRLRPDSTRWSGLRRVRRSNAKAEGGSHKECQRSRVTASAPIRGRVVGGYGESAEALAKAEDGGHKVHVATVPEARARVR